MSVNDTSRNGSKPTTVEESTEPESSQEPIQARESTVLNGKPEPATVKHWLPSEDPSYQLAGSQFRVFSLQS